MMTRRYIKRFRTTEGATVSDSPDTTPFSLEDRLDYIANHLRLQTEATVRADQMLNEIGQKVTNIEAFCTAVGAALEEMRSRPNPMLKMMGMMPPGLVVPGGATS